MSATTALFAILGALFIGAMSPGPSFVFVVRTAVARSRADGLAAAVGMGVGAMTFGALALLGLRTLMNEAATHYLVLKVAGGLYLVYLGVMIWRHATVPVAMAAEAHGRSNLMKSFGLALATQFSNPKIVAVFGAVFAALLPADPPLWLDLALPPLIFCQETLWYVLVAFAFSSAGPRAAYLRARKWIDRTAGAIIGLIGIRLIFEAR
jgi:threonine/homoserine/homoserine lactone efflux protein